MTERLSPYQELLVDLIHVHGMELEDAAAFARWVLLQEDISAGAEAVRRFIDEDIFERWKAVHWL